jgi:hypothetical protein
LSPNRLYGAALRARSRGEEGFATAAVFGARATGNGAAGHLRVVEGLALAGAALAKVGADRSQAVERVGTAGEKIRAQGGELSAIQKGLDVIAFDVRAPHLETVSDRLETHALACLALIHQFPEHVRHASYLEVLETAAHDVKREDRASRAPPNDPSDAPAPPRSQVSERADLIDLSKPSRLVEEGADLLLILGVDALRAGEEVADVGLDRLFAEARGFIAARVG